MPTISFKDNNGKLAYKAVVKDAIDDSMDVNNFALNIDYYNQLISNRQFQEAADYMSQYHFENSELELKVHSDINRLETEGRIAQAQNRKIRSKEDKNWFNFYGNLKGRNLNYTNGENENKIQNEFLDAYKGLGSYVDNNRQIQQVSKLKVVIPDKKRVGEYTGWDWIVKDNKLGVDDWIKRIGITVDELKSAGVQVTTLDDGSLDLTFDKSNKYAMDIITGTQFKTGDGSIFGYSMPTIYGVGDDGNVKSAYITNETEEHHFFKTLTTAEGAYEYLNDIPITRKSQTRFNNRLYLETMMWYINKADKQYNKIIKDYDIQKDIFSSIAGPRLFDSIIELEMAREQGLISETDFKRSYDIANNEIKNIMSGFSIHTAEHGVYSNLNNVSGDLTLEPIEDSKDKTKLQALLDSGLESGRLELTAFYCDGEYGTLLSIYPKSSKEQSEKKNKKDEMSTYATKIFVPGLLTEKAQTFINNDTKARAAIEINNMRQYGDTYEYKANDNIYSFDGKDFRINGNAYTDDGLHKYDYNDIFAVIQEDMISKDGINILLMEELNRFGNIIDTTRFKDRLGSLAIRGANDIYDFPFTDENGEYINENNINPWDLFTLANDYTFVNTYHNPQEARKWISYKNIYQRLFDVFKRYINDGKYVKATDTQN